MTKQALAKEISKLRRVTPQDFAPSALTLLNGLPHPVLAVAADGSICDVNVAAETFFQLSRMMLVRVKLEDVLPFGSPLLSAVNHALERGSVINEYRVDIGTPRIGTERIVDINVSPLSAGGDGVVIMLQERTIADKMDRQLTHRGAARSVTALASMLAHEIKNPLSGIRGAAQLLERDLSENDRELTRLICDETDRIKALIDRMEVFSDDLPLEREPVNIHT
ncbi:MAG: nitrogen regulation protein, partial [Hyphomicrobiales bacterium]|nr:nitrogen regulation protein [Hyphomicrobiales bacterium]